MAHADALSRLPIPDDEPVELESNYVSHAVSCVEVINPYCAVSDSPDVTVLDVARQTDRDSILAKVKDFVMCGWKEVNVPELYFLAEERSIIS